MSNLLIRFDAKQANKTFLFAWKQINIRFIFAYIRFEPNIAGTLLSLLFAIVLPLFFTSFPCLSLSMF
jgi:hypothetical protein